MGGSMIKNIIIASLIFIIVTGVSGEEFFTHIQTGLDYFKEIVYYIQRSVNNI